MNIHLKSIRNFHRSIIVAFCLFNCRILATERTISCTFTYHCRKRSQLFLHLNFVSSDWTRIFPYFTNCRLIRRNLCQTVVKTTRQNDKMTATTAQLSFFAILFLASCYTSAATTLPKTSSSRQAASPCPCNCVFDALSSIINTLSCAPLLASGCSIQSCGPTGTQCCDVPKPKLECPCKCTVGASAQIRAGLKCSPKVVLGCRAVPCGGIGRIIDAKSNIKFKPFFGWACCEVKRCRCRCPSGSKSCKRAKKNCKKRC